MTQPSRRRFLVCLALALLLAPTAAQARRGRVRFSGQGLPAGARYNGPTLTRPELKSCLQQERTINARMADLDRQELELQAAEARVDQYSQASVDGYNAKVARFNEGGRQANTLVANFNSQCANRAYYESDMRAVESELATR